MQDKFLAFYSRPEIQLKILEIAEDREVAPRYNQGFGRRPDVLQFPGDVLEMAKKGATSFHVSEERWEDPLLLKAGMEKKDLDENRKGWDLILDIDTPHWEFAKWCTYYLIEALKFHEVKEISVKFSGNKGFHIGVPFESFPDEVNGRKTKYLFPEGLRVIASYLQNMITPMLREKILENHDMLSLCSLSGKKKDELMKDGKLDPFVLVDIDTVLISNRHLFRSPYSMHEKSGLVSVPIRKEDVLHFDKRNAEVEQVKGDLSFLKRDIFEKDAKGLIIQAFDWWGKKHAKRGSEGIIERKKREIVLPQQAIPENNFPQCIDSLLQGKMEDGKKRAVFILVNFLKHMNWRQADIEERLKTWNKSHKSPLSQSYLIGQLNWHKRQREKILPPNCKNDAYYKDLGIKCNERVCSRYKNPVNCALSTYRWEKKKKAKELKKVIRKKTKKVKKKNNP